MGFLLSIIAYILFLPLAGLNFISVLFVYAKHHGFFKTVNKFWFKSAFDLDQFANYHFRTLFNLVLINECGYCFGGKNETISFVLGINQINKTLTITGWLIVYLLFSIDYKNWKNGGHCIATVKNTNY